MFQIIQKGQITPYLGTTALEKLVHPQYNYGLLISLKSLKSEEYPAKNSGYSEKYLNPDS